MSRSRKDDSTSKRATPVNHYLAGLVAWLREHAIGFYKPCAEAADVMEAQADEIRRLSGKAPGWWAKR
jgi:hypothetical protein